MAEQYNPKEIEERMLEFWKKNRIRQKAVLLNSEKKKFFFHDGPPYATGQIHIGTTWNKSLKDMYIRFFRMNGFFTWCQPGYDTHGTPIETKVEKKFGFTSKKDIEKFGIGKFNRECRKFATEHIESMNAQFEELVAAWMDWENPYITLENYFIEGCWFTFKTAYEKGFLYKGIYPVHVCPRCATAVAYNEIEHTNLSDTGIYVKFPIEGEKNKFFIIYTTTPWTLPGNTGIMVNPDFEYAETKVGNEIWVVAKDLVKKLDKKFGKEMEIVKTISGSEIEGMKYRNPLAKNLKLPEMKNAYRVILSQRYVHLDEGTGLVHTAPGHGREDYDAGTKAGLPAICPVELDGTLKKECGKYAGKIARIVDKEIIGDLDEMGFLVRKESITHEYPICWRCKNPLLQMSVPQWFFKVTEIRDKLLKENEKVNWYPADGKKRFDDWLNNLGDWPISRQRFWGIPLPIWECKKCKEIKVVGSIDEIRNEIDINKIFLVRHGDSENNERRIINSLPEKEKFHLTESGMEQIKHLANKLKGEKIDAIFSSPLLRTKETAEIISKKLGIEIIFDERIRELDLGEMNGHLVNDLVAIHPTRQSRAKETKMGVESGEHLRTRLENFLDEINKNYKNKNIVVVSHGDPIQMFFGITKGKEIEEIYKDDWYPKRGSFIITYSRPIDLHRPYIDEIVLKCKCGGEMKRVEDVSDVWFDSGCSSWASLHYPEQKELFEKLWPADFELEGSDQFRGWWNSQMLAGVMTFGKVPFRNVLVHGMVYGIDKREMHKSLGNFITPEEAIEKYGKDSLRLYLLKTDNGNNLFFNWDDMEAAKKSLNILSNIANFFGTYCSKDSKLPKKLSTEDRWIISRINSVAKEAENDMKSFVHFKALAKIEDFILNDFSRLYIKTARERLGEKTVSAVISHVLERTIKLLAPFCPFLTEDIYQRLFRNAEKTESVHLSSWPKTDDKLIDKKLEEQMDIVKKIVEASNSIRQDNAIKLKYPLRSLLVSSMSTAVLESAINLKGIIERMANVKDVKIGNEKVEYDAKVNFAVAGKAIGKDVKKLEDALKGMDATELKETFDKNDEAKISGLAVKKDFLIFREKSGENKFAKSMEGGKVEIDPKADEKLKKEWLLRELVRAAQEKRKDMGLQVSDKIKLYLSSEFKEFGKQIEEETGSKVFVGIKGEMSEFEFEGKKYVFGIEKK